LLYLIILSDTHTHPHPHPHPHTLTHTHTHTHTVGFLEIGLSQRLLPDYTKHTQPSPGRMPPARFEPVTPGSELPRARILDRAATGIGVIVYRDLSPI